MIVVKKVEKVEDIESLLREGWQVTVIAKKESRELELLRKWKEAGILSNRVLKDLEGYVTGNAKREAIEYIEERILRERKHNELTKEKEECYMYLIALVGAKKKDELLKLLRKAILL
ncbi:hypothetical protein DRP05_10530 [Archaeoglobales archaeon]|nr:MAG: hypothetical protein DRP05_10530 [Archaeoglobales archaeon]